ncbi:MAG: hypothetical protein ACRDX9_11005 [Acidimicrobiia bacterium]
MNERVRYLRRTDALAFGSHEFTREPNYSPDRFVAAIQEIGSASLASVRKALDDASGGEFSLLAVDDPFDHAISELVVTPSAAHSTYAEPLISFKLLASRQFQIEMLVAVSGPPGDLHDTVEQLARGFCLEREVELVRTFSFEKRGLYFHYVTLSLKRRGRTVADAYEAATSLYELWEKYEVADFSSTDLAKTTLRAGRPDLLLGQYESVVLECKSTGYDLSSAADKIEFGQDVARFANSDRGGILVLGLKTKSDTKGDRIVSVHPLPSAPKASRYHKILDRMIFPPVEGLTVEAVSAIPGGPSSLVVIDVPPQPEELKPFLVSGAVVHGRVEGAFISIVQRRGEHSVPVSPPAIHAALAAGRALLRGQPSDPLTKQANSRHRTPNPRTSPADRPRQL